MRINQTGRAGGEVLVIRETDTMICHCRRKGDEEDKRNLIGRIDLLVSISGPAILLRRLSSARSTAQREPQKSRNFQLKTRVLRTDFCSQFKIGTFIFDIAICYEIRKPIHNNIYDLINFSKKSKLFIHNAHALIY